MRLSRNYAFNGGGIFNDHAVLTVSNSTLSGNSCNQVGGGILNYGERGSAAIVHSTISGNSAGFGGGGIFNEIAALAIANSTISGNTATNSGGGIYNLGYGSGRATLTIVNSTLSENSATNSGGAIFNFGADPIGATLTIANSTVNGNSGTEGGGIYNVGSATVETGSTILKAGASGANITNFAGGTVTSLGYNLSSDDGGGFLTATGDQINTDPMLGPLQDNGGPTFTHAPLCGSPAIDKGKNFGASATDQRGLLRTFDQFAIANATDGTDVGAFEVQEACLPPCSGINFTQPAGSPVGAGTTPISVAVGDFNGDGTNDLAVANLNSGNVTILLGDGNGGFTNALGSPVGAGIGPQSVAVGDFDGDDMSDLAVANFDSGNVTILLGDGSGGFSQPAGSPVGAGSFPYSVAVGDFNSDDKPDLAVANFSSGNVTILLGDGNGGFSQPAGSPVGAGVGPQSVAVGDFDGDGRPDLAVANDTTLGTVTILLGDGSGGFSQPTGSPVSAGSAPVSVTVGDFNSDGKPDLAVANFDSGNVTILLNTCAANQPPVAQCKDVTASAGTNCVASASIDDGSLDPDAGDTITLSQNPPGPYSLGDTTVTLTVMDNHGASNSCSAVVTVNDTTAPSVTCPDDISTNIPSGQTSVVVNYPQPTASDNCGSVTANCAPASGSSFPLGVTNVTCTATDGSGNTGTCSFAVTVLVAAPCPDLTGVWSNLVQTCKGEGTALHCKLRGRLFVQNAGSSNAPTSLVRFYLSNDAIFDVGDTLLKQVATGKVKLVKPKKRTLAVRLPTGTSASGEFVIAVIDADNRVAECDENNNVIIFGPLP